MFQPLVSGGTMIMVSKAMAKDPLMLADVIFVSRPTILQATPASWSVLLDAGWNGAEGATLISTGEAIPRSLAGRLLDFTNTLYDLYGPTETTIWSTFRQITEEQACGSIGRPIANTQVYVLDTCRQPVPIGVPGELYIGGAGLARGYLNRPELTAEKFVANPFSDDAGSRLYRTGDECRWRADGNLEFLGRLDDQVKLRGFRIELGEIEAALNEQSAVARCVVTLREDRPGDKRLVAYCVPASDCELNFSDLRIHLQQRLPDYMVPAALVRLESLPLTPSGKINRRALPAPDDSRPELETGYLAPRNLLEEQLASIWCDVLNIERVGMHDNFFALGGHSLLVVRVAARASAAFGVELAVRRLFESPTIAQLAVEISVLRSGDTLSLNRPLKRMDRELRDRLPMSFAQQRLWFLEQMERELTAYNMSYAWRLSGSLNTEALRRALEAIVRRHEPLRTTFVMQDGEPVQVVGSSERFMLPVEDLGSFEPGPQEAEIVLRFRLEAERPFDLTCDLMLRASLLCLSEDEHVLLLTMHHIASDGWSLSVLWRELNVLYDAFDRGADPQLPELPVQYADYAEWQRQELQGPRLEQGLKYWRDQLEGVPVLEMPTDYVRPLVPTYRGAHCEFRLSKELVDQLKSLSQREGVTLHMLLLAAFQTLLSRYSGQDDIVVGTPIAGRSHVALEDMIGFFVNTLALRTDLSGNPTFLELLGRVREVSLAAYDHQDLPFEKLVEELRPDRHLSRSPLVQVLFQLLSFSDTGLDLRNLDVSRLPASSERVRFDLEMHLWQQPHTIRGSVVYSTDLFDTATIERMSNHFVTLLEGIVADADQRLSELPLLTESERHQLLVEWNDTAAEYPSERCVHELFEQQVERTPDAVAVVFEDEELTYRELNGRANRLAHHLRELGVGPETLVGLCLERSPELVVGILGILKASGAYVPLDANLPHQRLEFMLQDARLRFLVTQRGLLYRIPVTIEHPVFLSPNESVFTALSVANPQSGVGPDNLAYTMYTSGSTGRPKGVQIPHSAVVNFLTAMATQPGLTSQDRLLSVTTPTFDISVLELLLPLTVGACVDVLSSRLVADATGLAVHLSNRAVTMIQATPATWQMLIHGGWSGDRKLKLLCGGEALTRVLAEELRRRCGELWNMYGPTETTIWSTTLRVTDETFPGSIGRPIANTQVYVLDAHCQLVPIGIPGELHIGGAGLARGYLNRPELTAERFVANPFDDDPNSRLYRTGDVCRWRADGNLDFLGRLDEQVKLRGFRIELGEIETVLNDHPDVAQSVVTLREDRPGDKRLVAYWIPTAGTVLNFRDLRDHLRSRLPDYMVPAAFVELDALPLTASGKIDRRALPTPDDSRPELETGYVAPRTPVEQQLASIWCDLLGLEEVGVNDNFFALGGHSLLAVRMFARIEKLFGRKLPLAVLFQHGTIGHLAMLLTESSPTTELAAVLPLETRGAGRALFLMPSIGGELLFSKTLIEGLGGRFPVIGIQPALAARNLEQFRDFRQTACSLVSALCSYQPHGPYALAGYSYGGMMAYEVACLLTAAGETVDLLAIIDTGPGSRGLQPQFGDGCRKLSRIVANLPSWVRDEFRQFSARRLASSAARKLRWVYRHLASGGRAPRELDDVFDAGQVPSQNLELMRTVFAAFRDYEPKPYAGKLTLLRARIGPLLSGSSRDLGWGRLVDTLEIRQINGNHESILHRPHVNELARQLVDLMDALAAVAEPSQHT